MSAQPSPRTPSAAEGPRPSARKVVLAAAADLVLVVVFAAIGRASHGEAVFGGLAVTAWPFVVALVLGWLVSLAWRAPDAALRTGLPVWAVTVAGGMVLRAASGQGVQVAFIIVAAIVLLLFLVGWRAVGALVRAVRARRR